MGRYIELRSVPNTSSQDGGVHDPKCEGYKYRSFLVRWQHIKQVVWLMQAKATGRNARLIPVVHKWPLL